MGGGGAGGCFLLCHISGVLSSNVGKKFERFGNEFCAMLKSEIKVE